MSFLDDVASKAAGKLTGGGTDQTSGLTGGIMEILSSQPGGLSGLIQSFHERGLAGIVNSWISTGQNLPISAEQMQGVLTNEQVKQFAAKTGIAPEMASSKLAEYLPSVIDRLTPDGKVPAGGDLLQQALSFINQKS